MAIHKKYTLLAALLAAIALPGCSSLQSATDWIGVPKSLTSLVTPYRPDMHQGNLISEEMVSQLQVGMSQMQVQFLLGVPLVRDMFHQNRWDYVYYLNPRKAPEQRRRLTVFFDEDGRLSKYEYTPMPTETEADQMILGQSNDFDTQQDGVTTVQ